MEPDTDNNQNSKTMIDKANTTKFSVYKNSAGKHFVTFEGSEEMLISKYEYDRLLECKQRAFEQKMNE